MAIAKTLLIIYTLCSSQADYPAWREKIDKKYDQYIKDNDTGDRQKFLNRQVLDLLGNLHQTDESIKELMYYTSMYHSEECSLPTMLVPYVQNFGDHLCGCVIGHIKQEMSTCKK